ncbi:cytochrome P450 [Candidatus Blastococcus massiliensis]|uniref:cytochrome P450 n=1 Tax=Candidatus Blastococcus massiliensis TaxID=1470358 RepID=UPI0004B35142|nr:cytochrome P450 [Candidatus Blastococcus massiliensis]
MTVDDRFTEDFQRLTPEEERGVRNEVVTGPVSDWTTDFSHFEEEYAQNAIQIWDDLRGRCPVARTERFGGAWLPTRYEDVQAIAYDTDHFTSRAIIVSNYRPPLDLAPVGGVPPISSDPPFHHDARKLLLPAFTKTNVAKQEITTRAFCHKLIDAFEGKDVVDAAVDYGMHIPMRVIADMLGFPPEDNEKFAVFVERALEGANGTPEERQESAGDLFDYLLVQIRDHVANPRDDLTTYLINAELYGQKLEPQHVAGTMALLLIAGIDTTWSAIGASLWHLAQNPEDRKRLVEDPSLRPKAVEEFLRAYAPVTMARLVKEDVELGGVEMKKEDWVLLPFPAANRDPERFEDADKVIIDREVNRHAAFGLGIHRCVGSHLARMELTVALDVWLDRVPEFTLVDPESVRWSVGQIRGPRELPVRIG